MSRSLIFVLLKSYFLQGTPHFMPFEVLAGDYLLIEIRRSILYNYPGVPTLADQYLERYPESRDIEALKGFNALELWLDICTGFDPSMIPRQGEPVIHNFQHDLESIWWIVFWFITMRTGNEELYAWAKPAFTFHKPLDLSSQRHNIFRRISYKFQQSQIQMSQMNLLKTFPIDSIEKLRWVMPYHYQERAVFGQLMVPGSYSKIHAEFAQTFDDILQSRSKWYDTPVGDISELKAKKRDHEQAFEHDQNPADSAAGSQEPSSSLAAMYSPSANCSSNQQVKRRKEDIDV